MRQLVFNDLEAKYRTLLHTSGRGLPQFGRKLLDLFGGGNRPLCKKRGCGGLWREGRVWSEKRRGFESASCWLRCGGVVERLGRGHVKSSEIESGVREIRPLVGRTSALDGEKQSENLPRQ